MSTHLPLTYFLLPVSRRFRPGRDGPFGPPPGQIPAGGFPAPGSHLESDVEPHEADVPAGARAPASIAFVAFDFVALSPIEVSTTWLLLAALLPSIDSTGVTHVFADFLQVGTTNASDSSEACDCGLWISPSRNCVSPNGCDDAPPRSPGSRA